MFFNFDLEREKPMFKFTADELLSMDYRTLRKYTEKAVLQKPSLGESMRKVNIKEIMDDEEVNLVRRAKIRCISAYLGVADPYPLNNYMEEA